MQQTNPSEPHALRVIIEPATFADIGSVRRIQQESFRPGLAYSRLALILLWSLPIATFLVARKRDTGEVIGNIICDRQNGNIRIVNIAVARRARRQGVGRMLLQEVDRRFPTGDIVLAVQQENSAAQHLYEQEGYLRTAVTRNYYGPNQHGYTMKKFRRNPPTSITTP